MNGAVRGGVYRTYRGGSVHRRDDVLGDMIEMPDKEAFELDPEIYRSGGAAFTRAEIEGFKQGVREDEARAEAEDLRHASAVRSDCADGLIDIAFALLRERP